MSQIFSSCGGGQEDLPLVAGTLRGFRTWRVLPRRSDVPDGALPLTAVTRPDVVWPPMLAAECSEHAVAGWHSPRLTFPHEVPAAGCGCGIYAWYDPADSAILNAPVFGVVQASGRIMLGERGFRAERARVSAVATRNKRVTEACEAAGIPVYRSRRELLRQHPPEDVTSLLGQAPPPSRPERSLPWRLARGDRLLCYALASPSVALIVAGLMVPDKAVPLALAAAAHVLLVVLLATRIP